MAYRVLTNKGLFEDLLELGVRPSNPDFKEQVRKHLMKCFNIEDERGFTTNMEHFVVIFTKTVARHWRIYGGRTKWFVKKHGLFYSKTNDFVDTAEDNLDTAENIEDTAEDNEATEDAAEEGNTIVQCFQNLRTISSSRDSGFANLKSRIVLK